MEPRLPAPEDFDKWEIEMSASAEPESDGVEKVSAANPNQMAIPALAHVGLTQTVVLGRE